MTDRSSLLFEHSTSGRNISTVVPPWETRTMTQVPYLENPGAPPPTNDRPYTSQRSRSSGRESISQLKPRLVTANTAPARSQYNSPVSNDTVSLPWSNRRHTTASQPRLSAPYETFVDLPPEAMNFRRPHVTIPQPSPSPPESSSLSSTKSMSPPPPETSAHSLPGTMSSRMSGPNGTRISQSKAQRRELQTRAQQEHKPKKRFATAFRGIFKREPVDESQLERIDDRHWTEEN